MVRLFWCAESYAPVRAASMRFRIFGFKDEIEGVFSASFVCCALYPID